jgi:hypothetical protein
MEFGECMKVYGSGWKWMSVWEWMEVDEWMSGFCDLS